jgi:fengycin family lipopeptide synthetase E
MTSRDEREADQVTSAPPPASDPRDIATTIASLVADHAARRGDAIAVEDLDHSLTYGQLGSLAEHVGRAVTRAAPGPGPVGVLLQATTTYVAAIVGLLARGVVYVPLDESFPAARNAEIAARAGLVAVIVDRSTAPAMRELAPDLPQIEMPDLVEGLSLDVTAKPDDVAVIFYTSGSTGQPKGVYQSQRSILYEVLRHCARAGLVHDDRIVLVYSPSVSGSTRDIYGSLAAGARLCILDVKRSGLGAAARAMADWRITVLHSIPGLFRSIFAVDSADTATLGRSVRLVHLISDRVLRSDVELYQNRFSRDCRLCIDLATTETYSYASWYLDRDTMIDRTLVPVGYPRADIGLRLVNEAGQAAASGELGEIIVTGRALSLGYWRDEALTRARFSPSPTVAGAVEFRTGDMGRLLPDGLLEFVGRKDRQIKLRGNTVHLAEVEAALALCPDVAEAGVIARGAAPNVVLIAYCAPAQGERLDPDAVAAWCGDRLPPFMQPSEIVVRDALPRLPSGKPDPVELERVDRLRAVAAVRAPEGRTVVSASAAMRAVFDGWEAFLRPGAFDEDASFEASGGDSLKGLNLLLFLENRLGRPLVADVLNMKTRPSGLIGRLTQPDVMATGASQDDRPLLLLFAGLFGADVPTTDFARRLEARFLPVIVDFRWGGDDFAGDFSADAYFDQIIAVVRRHGARRLWLSGHSYGGKLAAEAARRLIEAGFAVEFVGIFDGLPKDAFLKRHSAALRGMILGERLRRGVDDYGNLFQYAISGGARYLGLWLMSHRQYGLLRRLLRLLSPRWLEAANFRTRRGVMAKVRLAAFRAMPLGPIAARLWLFLSNEDRFDPSLYPNLGWDAYFASIVTERLNVGHLGFFKDNGAETLIERLTSIEASLKPGP